MKTSSKVARQRDNPADQVMQAARLRNCPFGELTARMTRAIGAGLQQGEGSAQAASARKLHRQWQSLVRRHLRTIYKIRFNGEHLVKLEEQMVAFALAHGLEANQRPPVSR